jgi:hypothetical protein
MAVPRCERRNMTNITGYSSDVRYCSLTSSSNGLRQHLCPQVCHTIHSSLAVHREAAIVCATAIGQRQLGPAKRQSSQRSFFHREIEVQL